MEAAQDLLASLCADLRLLWTQAGGPSLRVLEDRLHLRKSQLGAILGGRIRRPPDWSVVRGLVESCHRYALSHGRLDQVSLRTGIDEYWRPRHAALEHAFSQRREPAPGRSAVAAAAVSAGHPMVVSPAHLPPAVAGFTGRVAALGRLDALLGADLGPAVPIVVIAGTAGVGKTSLAVHWAHRVADRFPDGQLYANLRGFDPTGPALAPEDVVGRFLSALGVRTPQMPTASQAQTDLYRSLLAGRRMLVVLDNAATVEQVRALLPGAPGCLVVVTSRNQLTGLIALEGADPLTLDLLSTDEARQLLGRRIGADRVAAEPAAVEAVLQMCARLPLALAIVAARAATRPGLALRVLADGLDSARGVLDQFNGGDIASDLRAVFSWSYRSLADGPARLFRLLGLHPGPDVTACAAASLAAVPVDEATRHLAELTGAHLLSEHSPGRFACHDLLRAYATELAAAEPDPDRPAAEQRMLDHYLRSAHHAALLCDPYRESLALAPARPGTVPEEPVDPEAAMAWFTAEQPVLVSMVTRSRPRWDAHAWRLAWTLTPFLGRQGSWHELVAMLKAALESARRLSDRAAEGYVHRSLGVAYCRLEHLDDARTHSMQAVGLFEEVDDLVGQADSLITLSWIAHRLNRAADADRDTLRALELYRAAGHRVGEARALNEIGWSHVERGEYEQAVGYCRQALAAQQEAADRDGEATAWDSLGCAYHHLGNHEQAVACYEHAIDLRRLLGDRYGEAETLDRLGDTYVACGQPGAARDFWRQAVSILDELGHQDADRVRAKQS